MVKTTILPLVIAVSFACAPNAPAPAGRTTVDQSVEIEHPPDITAYLEKQPAGATDAMVLDAMPPQVVVKISIQSTSKRSFETTFVFPGGKTLKKHWAAASGNLSHKYVAIFGFDTAPTSVTTKPSV